MRILLGGEKSIVASGPCRALETHPDFIGKSPFEVAPPQRFTVEG